MTEAVEIALDPESYQMITPHTMNKLNIKIAFNRPDRNLLCNFNIGFYQCKCLEINLY